MPPTTRPTLSRRSLTPAGTIILIISLLVIFFAGLGYYAFSKINLIVSLLFPLRSVLCALCSVLYALLPYYTIANRLRQARELYDLPLLGLKCFKYDR